MDPEEQERQERLRALELANGDVDKARALLAARNQAKAAAPEKRTTIGGLAEQVGAGLGEVLPTAALGLSRTLERVGLDEPGGGSDRLEALLDRRRQETAPDAPGEGTARLIGRAGGEGALAVTGAGAAGLGARGALFADIGLGGLISQAGKEESVAGAAAELTGSETLDKVAENPLTRAAAEALTIGGADALFRGAGRIIRNARSSVPAPRATPAPTPEISSRIAEIDADLDHIKNNMAAWRGVPEVAEDMRVARRDLTKEKDILEARSRSREELVGEFKDTIVHEPKANTTFREKIGGLVREKYRQVADRYAPFTRVQTLPGVSPLDNPELLIRNSDGFANEATTAIERGVYKPGDISADNTINTLRPGAKGLRQIWDDSGDPQALSYYLAAVRDEELISRGKPGRLTAHQRKIAKQQAELNPDLKTAADQYHGYMHDLLRLLEAEEVLSKGGAERIIQNGNLKYAPFHEVDLSGVIEEGISRTPGVGDPIFKIGKGTDAIVDPLRASVGQTYFYYNLIRKKRAHRALASLAGDGDDAVIRRIEGEPEQTVRVGEARPDVPDIVGGEIDPGLIGGGLRASKASPGRGAFSVRNAEGEVEWFEAPIDLIEAMRTAQPDDIGITQAIFRFGGRGLQTGIVKEPTFQLRNLFKDTFFRAIASDNLTFKNVPVLNVLESFDKTSEAIFRLTKEALRRTGLPFQEDEMVSLYMSSPGAFSNITGQGRNEYLRYLRDLEDINPGYESNFRTSMRELGRIINETTEIVENAPRQAEFQAAYQKAIKDGMSRAEAFEHASSRAAEITVNFRRRGASMSHGIGKTLSQGTAFWNPRLQGILRAGRLLKEHPIRSTTTGLAALSAPALGLYLVNRENDDWWALPQQERDTHFHIPIPEFAAGALRQRVPNAIADPSTGLIENAEKSLIGGERTLFLRLPVPQEIGVLFGGLPVNIISQFDPRNPHMQGPLAKRVPETSRDAFKAALFGMLDVAPITTPGQVGMELGSNTDFHTKRPVENPFERAQGSDPAARGRLNASSGGALVSDLTGNALSPAQVDHTVRGMFGRLGMEGLQMADQPLRSVAFPERGEAPAVSADEITFLRSLLGSRGSEFSDNVYSEYHRLRARDKIAKDGSANVVFGGPKPLTVKERRRFKALEFVVEHARDVSDRVDRIESNPDLSATEKREEMTAVRRELEAWFRVAGSNPEHRRRIMNDLPPYLQAWAITLNKIDESDN